MCNIFVRRMCMWIYYVRYLYSEDVYENLLCAMSLQANTTGTEMFKSLDGYISGQLNRPFVLAYAQTELLP